MAPSQHAVLSPSASERWLSCPASVRLIEALPKDERNQESVYAHEGTIAHALGELEASRHFGLIDDKTYLKQHREWVKTCNQSGITAEQQADMAYNIEGYVELIEERKALYPMTQVMLEQRMDTGVPTCWGTSDTVLVSPEHVEIIDLKYGVGVPVSAVGNPQLRLYALGAYDTFGELLGDVQTVRWTVYQPRIHNTSTEELPTSELLAWRESILPTAEAAIDGTGEFGPSDEACRWCPLSGQCRAQLEFITERDFSQDPDLLSLEEIGKVLEEVPGIKQWLTAVEALALQKAYSEQESIPGWKVVISGGNRVLSDPSVAAEAISAAGVEAALLWTEPKLKGLGELETLLKGLPKIKPEGASRARFQRLEDVVPAEAIGRTEGKPSLVREDDPRPAASPNVQAMKEFDDVNE